MPELIHLDLQSRPLLPLQPPGLCKIPGQEVVMAWGRKRSEGGGCVGWLALLLAGLALLVAWAAYRRTGGEVGTVLKDAGVQSGAAGADSDLSEWRTDLVQARDRLLERRPEVASERNLEQVRRDVEEVRASLERAYRKTGSGAKEQWKDLDADLERLQGQLKEGGSKALATLDAALVKIRDATNLKKDEKDEGDGRR
jgi:hypothetical protein